MADVNRTILVGPLGVYGFPKATPGMYAEAVFRTASDHRYSVVWKRINEDTFVFHRATAKPCEGVGACRWGHDAPSNVIPEDRCVWNEDAP